MSRESSKAASQKCANVWTARIIPLILIGIVGYVTWVVVVLVCGQRRPNLGKVPAC